LLVYFYGNAEITSAVEKLQILIVISDIQKWQNISFIHILKNKINPDKKGPLLYMRYFIYNRERVKSTVLSLETASLLIETFKNSTH
jgi:hypothetical protein